MFVTHISQLICVQYEYKERLFAGAGMGLLVTVLCIETVSAPPPHQLAPMPVMKTCFQ